MAALSSIILSPLLRFFGEGDAGFGQRAQLGCHAVVRIAALAEPAESAGHMAGEWLVIDCRSRVGLARKR